MTEITNCIVCLHCLQQAESAGQLQSAKSRDREFTDQTCEQCDGFLVDGEIFTVDIQP